MNDHVSSIETSPSPQRTPQSYSINELKNRFTRREFLKLLAIGSASAVATVIAPDVGLNILPAWEQPKPEWQEGPPIPVAGSKIQLIGISHNAKFMDEKEHPEYKDKIRDKIKGAPFVFLEYFDENIRPLALPTTPDENFQTSGSFGGSLNGFYEAVGKICAEEGKDVIVVNPDNTNSRYIASAVTAGLAAGSTTEWIWGKIGKRFKPKISRRDFLQMAFFAPLIEEVAIFIGAAKKIQKALSERGIYTSDLPENERALILSWSFFDWRDTVSAKGIETAMQKYQDEIKSGSDPVAFNGKEHQGMAEYLKQPERRDALKEFLYKPYNATGETSVRRYHFDKRKNEWRLIDEIKIN